MVTVLSCLWMILVGMGIGWCTMRGVMMNVHMAKFPKPLLWISALAVVAGALLDVEKLWCVGAMAFGIFACIYLRIVWLQWKMPQALLRRSRGGGVREIHGDGASWEVIHTDGSTVSYCQGNVTGMTFTDGTVLDLSR